MLTASPQKGGKPPLKPPLKTPPHVSIKHLRQAVGLTLDELADSIGAVSDTRPSRGTLSAVETGRRGASPELIAAIEKVYHLPAGAITTKYRPRPRARVNGGVR